MVGSRIRLSHLVLAGLVITGATPAVLMAPHAAMAENGQPEKIKVSVKAVDAVASQPLAVTIKNNQPTAKVVRSLKVSGQTFLSLKDVAESLDMALAVTSEGANGFFFKPENRFALDMKDRRVEVQSTRQSVDQQQAQSVNGEIWATPSALLAWFDVAAMVDPEKNNVHFSTPNLLPREAKNLREKKWAMQKNAASAAGSTNLPTIAGEAAAGFEVEVYQTGTLLAYQQVEKDGGYRFTDLPVKTDKDEIQIVLYGPQGQVEKRVWTPPVQIVQPNEVQSQSEKKLAAKSLPPATEKPQPTIAPPPTTGRQTFVIKPQNWKEYAATQGDESLGTIEAYVSVQGIFVRLDAMLRALRIKYAQPASPNNIEIDLSNDHHIMIDMAQRSYVDQGQHYPLRDNEAFVNDDKIYLHEALVHRLFDQMPFTIDQAQARVTIAKKEVAEKAPPVAAVVATPADKTDVAPPPAAAPVTPVIIDDLVSAPRPAAAQEKETSPEKFEAHDVLHIEQTKTEQPAAADGADKNIEPLVLQPRLKTLPPMAEFVEAMDKGGQVYLPINDLFQILDFPIKVDAASGRISGYTFSPENDFVIDINQHEAKLSGKRIEIAPQDLLKHENQTYVNAQTLEAWFGIAGTIDRQAGTVHLTTERLLPAEEQEARKKKWSKLIRAAEKKDDDYPLLQNEYRLFGYPTLDVNLSSSYTHSADSASAGDKAVTNGYNVQGAAELAYLTTQFYAQGSTSGKTIDTLRLQAGRKDPGAGLLGPLHATEFEMGDIVSPSLSFVTANSLGRGAMVTNRDVTTSENFDVRTFTGDSVPGYEVELYRNNMLLSFQTVDANGRYTFKDIPILYGENTFRLVFYGPQGQREERIETVSAASALLKENQFEYTLGAMQRGFGLLPVGKDGLSNTNTPDGTQLVGGVRYGLTSNYSVGASVAETQLLDGPHRYVAASTGANWWGLLSETTFAKDMTSGGWASGMSVLTGFEGVSLRARYRRYNNFMSEAVNSLEEPLTSEARVDLNSQVYLPLLQEFTLGVEGLRETFVNPALEARHTYGVRFAKSLWGFSLTNGMDYVVDSQRRIQDTFGLQTRLWDINFRATGLYELRPDNQFRSATVMADYRLTDRLSAQTQIERDLSDRTTSLNQNVNWDFDTFRLSFNNMVNSHGDFSVGMNVLFSLSHDDTSKQWRMQPQAASVGGAVTGRVFVDDNDNGKYDEGEKLITDARLRVNRAPVRLDENGYFVTPVTPYQKSKVELSVDGLTDPLLTPKVRGYQVLTRPGDTVTADFPLVHTTIIDGTTFVLDEEGNKREVGNMVVELQDKDGHVLRRVVSEVDGYFSFDKVSVGEYWLAVPDEVLDSMNLKMEAKKHLPIAEVKEFVTGNDLFMTQKEKLNGPPRFESPLPALPSEPPPAPPQTPPTLPQGVREEKAPPKKTPDQEGAEEPQEATTNNDVGEVNVAP